MRLPLVLVLLAALGLGMHVGLRIHPSRKAAAPRLARAARRPPADLLAPAASTRGPGPGEPGAAREQAPAPGPDPGIDSAVGAGLLLRGRLLDEETGLPLGGRRLELRSLTGHASPPETVTDGHGAFELALVPGEYLPFHRASAGAGADAVALELLPHRLEVAGVPGGAPCERDLVARRPGDELVVRVLLADGRPAAGALVTLSRPIEAQPRVDPTNRTDAEGLVRLGVWRPTEPFEGLVRAQADGGLRSELLPVEAPFVRGERRLVLAPGGELRVRVRRAAGEPLAGRRVLLASTLDLGPRVYRETDAAGDVLFDGLFPGTCSLEVERPELGLWDARDVTIGRGERSALEVVLDDAPEPLVASGRVLDEEGRPLAGVALGVRLDGAPPRLVRTDAAGAFSVRARGVARACIGASAVQQGDLYRPASLDVAAGTEGLVLERVAEAAKRTFEVEVVDRDTGRELERFVATLDRGPGTEPWADSYAARRRFELRLLPDARWRVAAPDHVVAELPLLAALDELPPGARLRVELAPGLDHVLVLQDAATRRPVPGARVTSPTGEVSIADAEGRVRVRGERWCAHRVTAEGYAPATWDPEDELLWGGGPVLLERR